MKYHESTFAPIITREPRTTDIDKLKQGSRFNWGDIISIEEVGPYTIAAFHPWKRDGCSVLTGQPDKSVTNYHGWIEGRDTSHSWESLDAALAGLIAYRRDGPNSQAGLYFIRGLNQ